MRVVVDTDVWISAALSRAGPPAQLVRYILTQGQPVLTARTFNELQTRLWKPKFDRYISMELRKSLLHDLNAVAHWVEVPPEMAAVAYGPDGDGYRDDDAFIHAALAAQAAWLVTGDQDLLTVPALPSLNILTPAAALAAFGAS